MKLIYKLAKTKLKVCVVDNIGGSYLPIAKHLTKYFDVYYHSVVQNPYPETSVCNVGYGYPDIKVLKDFWSNIDNIDLFIFPDIYFKSWGSALRKMGKLVFGASPSEDLETDRKLFKEELKSVGLEVAPTQYIIGIDNLVKYLKSNVDKWLKISYYRGAFETYHHINWRQSEVFMNELRVSLGPLGNLLEFMVEDPIKSIAEIGGDGYLVNGNNPNSFLQGIEVKDCGYIGKNCLFNEMPQPIQDVYNKFRPILQKYNHTGFYSSEIRVGENGLDYYTDICCFSDDTEILTNEGWKLFKDLNRNELVATLNPSNNHIEYHKPYNYIEYDYEGELINITNDKKTIDKLVTPNHSTWTYYRSENILKEYRTENLTGRHFIPRTGIYEGKCDEYFILPEYKKEWYSGDNYHIYKECVKEDLQINMKDWCEFMGWFLSEGSLDNYNVNITQYKYCKEVKECLDKLPFKYTIEKNGFRILSLQLNSYLRKYGKCFEKYIPEYILNGSTECIESFLYSFNLGDGSIDENNRTYFSTSKVMANQLTELIFKLGGVGVIKELPMKGTIMSVKGGKEYIRNNNIFVVGEYYKNINFYFEASGCRKDKYIKKQKYKGKVYDVTVNNHIIYVRRKGRPFWSGNCRSGNPPGNVVMTMINNWDEILIGGARNEVIEPKYNGKYGMELILKSTVQHNDWNPIVFNKKYFDNINLKSSVIYNGISYVVPYDQVGLGKMCEFGSVSMIGNDIDSVSNQVLEIANEIECFGLTFDENALTKARESIKKIEDALKLKF